MKVKLLKRLRKIGRDQVHVNSVTKTNGVITGMSYGHDGSGWYQGLFNFGDTEEEITKRACGIYLRKEIDNIREKYKKYSVKCK